MGANLLDISVTASVQSHPATSLPTDPPSGIAFERRVNLLQYQRVQGRLIRDGIPSSVTKTSQPSLDGGAAMRALLLGPVSWAILTACSGTPPKPTGESGRLEARWTGADTGAMAAPATAEWCDERRALEIRGVQGDTGLALVLYPVDSIEADTYRVVRPDGADTLAPAAGIALRLFQPNSIQGYQGDSGTVVLERAESGELSATLSARARSAVNGQLITLSGSVRGLTVMPQTRGCGAPPPADSADTNTGTLPK